MRVVNPTLTARAKAIREQEMIQPPLVPPKLISAIQFKRGLQWNREEDADLQQPDLLDSLVVWHCICLGCPFSFFLSLYLFI